MAINNFPGSSGGGLPGHNFIDQIYVSSRVRKWTRSGSPGFYRALSGLGEPGFIFFVQNNGTLVQAPLGGVAEVTLPFTEIRVLTAAQDLISLYKVAAKTTDSLTLSPNYQTITSTGLYTFSTNGVGFADALLVGGGGAAYRHGGGGGGGGILEITSIPMKVGGTFAVTIGAVAAVDSGSNGGDTTFLNHTAKGGGGAAQDAGRGANGPTGGGGTVGSSSNSFGGGTGDANAAQLVIDTSRDSWLATVGTSLSVPLPIQSGISRFTGSSHNGGSINGNGHTGGGGGGAAGNGANGSGTTPGAGGPGVLINWGSGHVNKYFSAGGGGSNHNTTNNGPGGGTGWNNSAGHYGMGSDSEHNSVIQGTGGVVYVRTWSV
jgi:hypothetical protein